jgi:hypothetical protein
MQMEHCVRIARTSDEIHKDETGAEALNKGPEGAGGEEHVDRRQK